MLEQFNLEKAGPLRKDLFANPCGEMPAVGLCPPVGRHFKRKVLYCLKSSFKDGKLK
jgi:hypothetical protein